MSLSTWTGLARRDLSVVSVLHLGMLWVHSCISQHIPISSNLCTLTIAKRRVQKMALFLRDNRLTSRHVYRRHFLSRMMLVIAFLASMSLWSTQVDAWVSTQTSTIQGFCRSVSFSNNRRGTATSSTTTLPMAVSSCFAEEQSRELVERFGAVWEDEVEKVFAYESLQLTESKDKILDACVAYIQKTGKESPILAGRRWDVRLPSRRATVGCYGRILAEMNAGRILIDAAEENAETNTVPLEPEETNRRHLNYLLELLSTYPRGVWGLERDMMKESGIENFGQDYLQTKETK